MNLTQLAADLQSGAISLPEWEAAMRDYLRGQYEAATILSKGGREFVTFSDWGYEGSLLKKQYAYLGNFAKEIAANPEQWLQGGRLETRMNLYKDSAYAALADMQAREAKLQGYDQERNLLGVADHCGGCLDETARGWVALGDLVPIGSRTCIVNCKCSVEYRRSTE